MSKRNRRTAFCLVLAALASGAIAGTAYGSGHEGGDLQQRNAQTRVVGGAEATPGNWPSIVAIYRAGNPPASSRFCAGTLIASRWVLTTAACVVDNSSNCTASPCNPGDLEVLLGRYDLEGVTGETRSVTRVLPNPLFNSETRANDNALLELNGASLQPVRRVVSLAEAGYWEAGDIAQVAGWGDTDGTMGTNYPSTLMEAAVNVVSGDNCSTSVLEISGGAYVCAGGSGTNACDGDSGGPLEVATPSGRRLIGVVSFGSSNCGGDAAPTYFSRVIQSRDWLGSYAAEVTSPTTTRFGRVKRLKRRVKTLTISNNSSLPASIASVSVAGRAFKKISTTCPDSRASLENDSSCTVKVSFRPTRKASMTGALSVVSTTGLIYASTMLSGIGR